MTETIERVAGRELDAEVARVFRFVTTGDLPHFSADIREAWRVVEAMRARGWVVRVQEMPDCWPFRTGSGWEGGEGAKIPGRAGCILYPTPAIKGRRPFQVIKTADTAPLAICLAALDASK